MTSAGMALALSAFLLMGWSYDPDDRGELGSGADSTQQPPTTRSAESPTPVYEKDSTGRIRFVHYTQGLAVPGLGEKRIVQPRRSVGVDPDVYETVFAPRERLFAQSPVGTSRYMLIQTIHAYDVRKTVFAYALRYTCAARNEETGDYTVLACTSQVIYSDGDGDGSFETIDLGDGTVLPLPDVPDWARRPRRATAPPTAPPN